MDNKRILDAIRSENETVRAYAIKYFKKGKIDNLEVINRILEYVEKSDDKFEILDALRSINATALGERTLEKISNSYFFDDEIDVTIDLLIAYATIELLKKREDIRPKKSFAKTIINERFKYYEMDYDKIWHQLWNMDDTHEEFGNDYRMLTALADRDDFDYEKFHNEIHIDSIPGYEEVKKINLSYLAGMLKDEEMIGYLLNQVYFGSADVCEVASKALVKIGGDFLIELIKANYEKVPGHIKISLLNILEGVKLESSEELLMNIFETEKDEALITQALFALVSHLSKKAIPLLLEALNDESIFRNDYIEGLYVLHKLYNIEHEKMNEWELLVQEYNKKAREIKLQSLQKREVYHDNHETETFVSTDKKVGRNDPCPCGSGKKYKKCCINK